MSEPLTDREQRGLEHLRHAESLEVSVAEYARTFALDVNELYSAKQSLVRKGALPPRPPECEEEPGEFVAVQVAPSIPGAISTHCRFHHPSGLVIECSDFPPTQWLAVLLGSTHVPG